MEKSLSIIYNILGLKIILITLISFFLNTSSTFAWTTHQNILVKNANKNNVIQMLESYVVDKGFSFEYANPQSGMFKVFCKQSSTGYLNHIGETVLFNNKVRNWGFSLQIIEKNNYVLIKGSSRGGIAPGRYVGGFVDYLKASGFHVLTDENRIKQYVSSNVSVQNEVRVNPLDEKLKYLEIKTLGKSNVDLTANERISLLEIHLFKSQFTNMSNDARIRALENIINQGSKTVENK